MIALARNWFMSGASLQVIQTEQLIALDKYFSMRHKISVLELCAHSKLLGT